MALFSGLDFFVEPAEGPDDAAEVDALVSLIRAHGGYVASSPFAGQIILVRPAATHTSVSLASGSTVFALDGPAQFDRCATTGTPYTGRWDTHSLLLRFTKCYRAGERTPSEPGGISHMRNVLKQWEQSSATWHPLAGCVPGIESTDKAGSFMVVDARWVGLCVRQRRLLGVNDMWGGCGVRAVVFKTHAKAAAPPQPASATTLPARPTWTEDRPDAPFQREPPPQLIPDSPWHPIHDEPAGPSRRARLDFSPRHGFQLTYAVLGATAGADAVRLDLERFGARFVPLDRALVAVVPPDYSRALLVGRPLVRAAWVRAIASMPHRPPPALISLPPPFEPAPERPIHDGPRADPMRTVRNSHNHGLSEQRQPASAGTAMYTPPPSTSRETSAADEVSADTMIDSSTARRVSTPLRRPDIIDQKSSLDALPEAGEFHYPEPPHAGPEPETVPDEQVQMIIRDWPDIMLLQAELELWDPAGAPLGAFLRTLSDDRGDRDWAAFYARHAAYFDNGVVGEKLGKRGSAARPAGDGADGQRAAKSMRAR
ncbi:hypothetical protein Q5752_000175 [Cryptotrichosporon argae]